MCLRALALATLHTRRLGQVLRVDLIKNLRHGLISIFGHGNRVRARARARLVASDTYREIWLRSGVSGSIDGGVGERCGAVEMAVLGPAKINGSRAATVNRSKTKIKFDIQFNRKLVADWGDCTVSFVHLERGGAGRTGS